MGTTGYHLKGVFSLAPCSGQSSFTVMSLHINNQCAKKRGIGINLLLTSRAVMLKSMWTWLQVTSTATLGAANAATDVLVLSKKLSPTQIYRCHVAPHSAVSGEWADVCGFLKPPDSFE